MNHSVRNKLSVMMFLEFFIWGAWYPLIFGYLPSLGFTTLQQGFILNTFALASFTAMFFSTQFVDRNFAAEKFLAFSQIVGGLAILALTFVSGNQGLPTGASPWTANFWIFFSLLLVHCLFYVPTISITNSIAFTHLKDAQRDFGLVRLWGTIGWIAASWPFIFILIDWSAAPAFSLSNFGGWIGDVLANPLIGDALRDGTRYTFLTAGIASLLLGAYSLVLPHTPPKPAGQARESLAWLEAMKLLRVPFVLVLFVATFIDSAVHQCYFIWTARFLESIGIGGNWVMPIMSIGQVAEIFTMAFLGLVLKNLGWRVTMIVGILGHAVRFGMFALVPEPAVAITVNVLHGICYAFFFATVYIFVDEFFPKDARASAQGLFNFLILGLGIFVANFAWPALGNFFMTGNRVDFQTLFLIPSATALFAALLLLVGFRPPASATAHVPGAPADDWQPAYRGEDQRSPGESAAEKVQPGFPGQDPGETGIKERPV
ncbi:MAG: MFS transporter [Gemmataceae bacterium]|nr:MFS transporter [Gemmataceae bacterium]MCI0739240.1 MFS transporter [Gemmataceae bacterium]